MQDVLGRDLEVGQCILFATRAIGFYSKLQKAVIVGFSPSRDRFYIMTEEQKRGQNKRIFKTHVSYLQTRIVIMEGQNDQFSDLLDAAKPEDS